MQHNIKSLLTVCQSENEFSFDELILKMEILFEEKAFPEIIAQIIMLIQENIKLKIMTGQNESLKCKCGSTSFVLNGHRSRSIKTRLGKVEIGCIHRVKCRDCGCTFAPVLRFMGLEPYQSKTQELEKLVVETVSQNTYRRAQKDLSKTTGVNVSHTTFHNWMIATDCDEIEVPDDVIGSVPGQLLADGTKCKSIGDDKKPKQGDIKVLLGVSGNGDVFPVGSWTSHETWEEISESLERKKIKFPDGTVLVCDGEPGLADALSKHVSEQQRCHWHIIHDMYHMMWGDGGTMKEAKPVQDALKVILAVELPKEDFELVSEKEKDDIEELMEDAEGYIEQLVKLLHQKGYTKAANYLYRSKNHMFGYVRRWLSMGIACPRASSLIERTMREIARRVKRISYNWKEKGLGKVVKVLLKIFSTPERWEAYWKEKMKLNQSVMLSFRLIKA